ncbi:hypothetical protein [Tumebacillus lipolyticus]|uniref:Peptidase M10 metallopeptidase domain-containing protein n=1 Tax=Tumebacillus lipolyticus TaxID=1280370 RepID=A0ABW5A1Z2_9BACL
MMTSKRMKSTVAFVVAISSVGILDVAYSAYYNRDAFFSGNGLPDAAIAELVYWESQGVSDLGYSGFCLDARWEFDKVENAVINFRRATSNEINNSKLRFWADDFGDTSWYGHMTPYDIYGNPLVNEGTAWSKTDVQLNDAKMDKHNFVANERRKVVVHELGHVLSMRHQPEGTSSVMQDDRNTYWYLSPLDVSNLQYMY